MELISKVSGLIDMVFISLFLVLALAIGITTYLFKFRKISATVEKINYDNFNRKDTIEYIKFDDVISDDEDVEKSPGMIRINETTFVAGLSIVGYNYSSSSAAERERTMANAISFFNIVEEPIQLRQTAKAVDMSYNIKQFEEILHNIELQIARLNDELEDTKVRAAAYSDNQEEFNIYLKQLDSLHRTISCKKHAHDETRQILRYLNNLSGSDEHYTQKINQLIYSYEFNANDYTEELSDEQIILKAKTALANKGALFKEALAKTGCKAKRLSAEDLVLLIYKHTHPFTGDDVVLSDVINESYKQLFTTSDSLLELEREKRGDEAIMRQIEEYEREREAFVQERMRYMEEVAIKELQYVVDEIDREEGGLV